MINYYKYLPVSREDESWGLCVLNTGCTHIEATGLYPFKNHPAHHYFNWDIGRVLNEYQIIYITRGKGIFESDSCKRREIKAGTIIILFPGERHRYKPDNETGWDEYWVGIKGDIIDNLVRKNFLRPDNPSIYIGFHEGIFSLFNSIIEVTKRENTGYQPLISGAALHLMGNFHFIFKQNAVECEEKEMVINKARLLFRSNIANDFSPEQAAEELQVGYSWFRKAFKSYTGLSPGQYYIQLKVERAKELLNNPDIPIKQIAYDLRFDSYFYFSKMFKEKTGMTPTDYRKRAMGVIN
ncbi:AraC family transcriptional regulator [Mucilaginibacter aquariorum]|jgi:AraC-like DNA-binding protein|uniref:AraC family transcriptional regulator n=1 Tax=Mucilaginibacter aquariorum TaxID=2967225 RepID=A0ABT1SZJ4_9SPHI|nr:AraC family transcriptional regulator [Mucilaginibacter aquariorum]MCQ6957775.1 AraC family transcriptional regulator [Mucilaginibacter aquariorum]